MPQSDLTASPMAIVLAAGKGTRMESELPKVLVPVNGRPMIGYVLDALREAGVGRTIVVVGYCADLVREELADRTDVEFAMQEEQRGTGHAVMMCREQLREHRGPVVVVTGDSPMLQASSVRALLAQFAQADAACVLGTAVREVPQGYGRVVRDAEGKFSAIVEEKDATDEQRALCEINVSTYVFDSGDLLHALDQLTDTNAQGEYYVTDCPSILLAEGRRVSAHQAMQPCEALSINSMDQLRHVEQELVRMAAQP